MRTSIHSGGTGNIRHSPRNGFNGLYVISPVTSSLLPPSPHGLNGFTCPVGPTKPPRGLASATDARTTRLRRTLQRRSSARQLPLTMNRPAIAPCAPTLPRPPHPALHVRDDRDTPLFGRGGMARRNHRFLKNRSDLFLPGHLDSRINVELLHKIRFHAHEISSVSGPPSHAASRAIERTCPTSGKSVDWSAVARTVDQPNLRENEPSGQFSDRGGLGSALWLRATCSV
jgi:hypothetical protein